MKKSLNIPSIVFMAVTLITISVVFAQDVTGNGAPSGAHYTLNIIGVSKDKIAEMDANSGHRIFVPLWTKAKILLTEAVDFNGIQVLDANGTDSNGAAFALPNPDPDGNGVTSYSVFVRALGKPDRYAKMQTCYTDETGTWCATDFAGGVEQITIARTKGTKPTFTNVTKDLLYIDYCAAWSTTEEDVCVDVNQVPLFSEDVEEYFWEYDNHGLKLAQLRFYEVPTTTPWTP